MDYPVNSITAALFYPRVPLEHGVAFANEFIQRTGSTLDYEPMVLPLREPVPPDAPRIVLRSRDSLFVCELALNRVNFHYYGHNGPPQSLERVFPRYREALYRVITALSEMIEEKANRLGFVVKIVKQTAGDASAILLDEFICDERFDEAVETHLHFLHQFELEGLPCNRWVRFRSLRPPNAQGESRHALFEIDVNTRAEYNHVFASHEVVSFFLEAYEHARKQAERLMTFAGDEA